MPPITSIAIVGAGAMGGAYAAMLDAVPEFETVFVARGARAARLAREGLIVNDRPLNLPVVRPGQATAPVDLIMVALKHHHLEEALPDMAPFIGAQTAIISIMNGLESEETIGARYGKDKVLPAIAVGIDALREGNRISHRSPGRLIFGEAENRIISPRVRRVQETFTRAGVPHETPEDMRRTLWWKFMINVGMNQASAVTGATYGVFRTSKDVRALMQALMEEVITLAGAYNVNLSAQDIEDWLAILPDLAPDGKTSMLQDMEAGRPTEVDIFGGKVVSLGRERGIPTPVNAALLNIIRVLEAQRSRPESKDSGLEAAGACPAHP
jgi:2-dehydropantoate 2-reductase